MDEVIALFPVVLKMVRYTSKEVFEVRETAEETIPPGVRRYLA
jgi:hypothetical protein